MSRFWPKITNLFSSFDLVERKTMNGGEIASGSAWRRALVERLVHGARAGAGGVCRLCLRALPADCVEAGACSARDEFALRQELACGTVSLADMVETCSGVKVLSAAACAGSRVCASCAEAARDAYLFVLRCRRSEVRLAALVRSLSAAAASAAAPPPPARRLHLHLAPRPPPPPPPPEKAPRHTCPSCPRSFARAGALARHVATHGERRFACGACPRRFALEARLERHVRDAHAARSFVCARCGRTFGGKSSLRAHEESHRRKCCARCGKGYKNKKSYAEHSRLCAAAAPTNLNTQRAAGAGVADDAAPRYVCDHCGKIFFRKQSLLVHVKTLHLRAKCFACDACGKRFRTKGQVKGHGVVHTRERPERCDVCGRHFITKYALLYHRRLHTGERPHACELCGERFVSSSRLAAHRRVRHRGPSEECPLCFGKFYTKYSLRVHTRRHYNPTSKLYCKPPPQPPPHEQYAAS